MGLNINWGQILGTLIAEIIKIITPWAKDAMAELIEWAYEAVEKWAGKLKGEDKPDSTEKMAKAVSLVQVFAPELGEPEARILLEAQHLDKQKA